MSQSYKFDLQAHRGGVAHYPENTLAAFTNALELGVDTLELDVVVSNDKKVVVSHEAYMRANLCLTPTGSTIIKAKAFNLYEMDYAYIKTFDCGSLGNVKFPHQTKCASYKPLLSEVLQLVKSYHLETGKFSHVNIEIKSSQQTDHTFHPKPSEFVRLVMATINAEKFPIDKISIQSFDVRILNELSSNFPKIKTALLVEKHLFSDNIITVKCCPSIYSPYYKLLDETQIIEAHDRGMKVIPWTVNDVFEMEKLLKWGVDGIITDCPQAALRLK